MIGALHGRVPRIGMLITTAEFTQPAKDASQRVSILLIDRDRLGGWMNGEPLRITA